MAATEESQAAETAPLFTTAITPSGVEIRYSWAPKRKYEVRQPEVSFKDADGWFVPIHREWREVPSVTTVLGCLDKPLSWWGQGVGVAGVIELFKRGVIRQHWHSAMSDDTERLVVVDAAGGEVDTADIVKFLTEQKLTVNHTLSNAGDRGSAVHDAFEDWAKTGQIPHPEIYPEEQAGYVTGLVNFIRDFDAGGVGYPKTEVMVGSLEHGYAGRFDLRCWFGGGKLVTKSFPKRADKVDLVPEGSFLLDLKTSSGVYASHMLQLEAYEGASIECGYSPTDCRAVIHVTADGRYEFVRSNATLEDFLTVRRTYAALRRIGGKS